MNIYTGLLFQQGYIQNPELARSLAASTLAASSPASPRLVAGRVAPPDATVPCKPFRRGAIAAVCSIALSPFR